MRDLLSLNYLPIDQAPHALPFFLALLWFPSIRQDQPVPT